MIRHQAVAECICDRRDKERVLLEKKFILISGFENFFAAIRMIVYMATTIRFLYLLFIYSCQGSKNRQQ